jgi:hypothetical protein
MIVAGDMPTVLANGAGCEFALHALEILAIDQGRAEDNAISWLHDNQRIVRIAPFLVVSSMRDSSVADAVRAQLGCPVAALDVDEQPVWYVSPPKAA